MSNQMQIEVVNVSVSTVPTAKGSYQVADVAYKNKSFQDKLEGKKVMSFTNKDVFEKLTLAKFGDVLNVSREKNDKGYWDWTAIGAGSGDLGSAGNEAAPAVARPSAGAGNPTAVKNASPKSTYETPEERAARQILIVRQSSISSAVDLAVANKVKDPQEVIAIAKQFEDYVFNKNEDKPIAIEEVPEPPKNFFEGMTDDIPYQ